MISITLFFAVGGTAAVIMRLQLLTPHSSLVEAETYNKLFTLHGIVMVFFFLVPSIPDHAGKFPRAPHDRRPRPRFSTHQSFQLVSVHIRRIRSPSVR